MAQYDAVRLFVDRASAVQPRFRLDASNSDAVAQLCQRLDGVPLAIELATVWLRTLTPVELLAHLRDRYALLSRGKRDAPRRQQSLHSLVDWSYQLCDESERSLWRSVSVFAQGFELDAARAVWHRPEMADLDLLRLVHGLVEKSVLVRDELGSGGRNRMPEIIRQYGLEGLQESGEVTAVRLRHLDWCIDLAAQARRGWVGPEQAPWFGRVRRELANVRVAFEFSLSEPGGASRTVDMIADLTDYWLALGFLSEGRHWLAKALRSGQVSGLTRVRGLRTASILAALQGDQRFAAQMLQEAAPLVKRLGSAVELAWVSYAHALAAFTRGDLVAARGLYDEASRLFRGTEDLNAGERLRSNGCDVRIALLPNGEDPASYLTDEHNDLSIFRIDAALPLIGAQVERVLADQGDRMQWVEGRVGAARILANYLTTYPAAEAVRNAGWIAQSVDVDHSVFAALLGAAFRDANTLPPLGDRSGDLLRDAARYADRDCDRPPARSCHCDLEAARATGRREEPR